MKRGNRDKAKLSTKIFSGIFFLTGLTILVLIGISLGKETYRKRQIQKEIDSLQIQIEKMNQENSDLENLMDYLSSTDFEEKEGREKFNLQKGDEKMIVFRKDAIQNEAENKNESDVQAPSADKSPNWQKWWRYFFGNKT